ncbi:CPBP family intramembrane glutamic endopeptidase [Lusitaniella coriacea]|uniref:CPBP family intramembrane glutamic endopeptidase n=1 Tax=Lusitaniella coriacea TaxID=1983105 RepID=UPI003CF7E8C3
MLANLARRNALIALLLLVPVASFGVTMAVYIAPGQMGQLVFSLCKIWLLGLPVLWFFWHDRLKLSLPKRREWVAGISLGLVMFATILAVYGLWGQSGIDAIAVREKAQAVGIGSPTIYFFGALYFILINSLLEEIIWRWFVYRQWEILVPVKAAIILSAFCFTLHHIIALSAYLGWTMVILGSLGVFLAGVVWSWCYLTYRSIWVGYFSHILADLAIALVAWDILFT